MLVGSWNSSDRVSIRELAQSDELENPLSAVEGQLGWPTGDQQVPELALTEQVIEFSSPSHKSGTDRISKVRSR